MLYMMYMIYMMYMLFMMYCTHQISQLSQLLTCTATLVPFLSLVDTWQLLVLRPGSALTSERLKPWRKQYTFQCAFQGSLNEPIFAFAFALSTIKLMKFTFGIHIPFFACCIHIAAFACHFRVFFCFFLVSMWMHRNGSKCSLYILITIYLKGTQKIYTRKKVFDKMQMRCGKQIKSCTALHRIAQVWFYKIRVSALLFASHWHRITPPPAPLARGSAVGFFWFRNSESARRNYIAYQRCADRLPVCHWFFLRHHSCSVRLIFFYSHESHRGHSVDCPLDNILRSIVSHSSSADYRWRLMSVVICCSDFEVETQFK